MRWRWGLFLVWCAVRCIADHRRLGIHWYEGVNYTVRAHWALWQIIGDG